MNNTLLDPTLADFLESEIVPEYDNFDKAHQRDHVHYVMSQAIELSGHYDVDRNMVLAAAAYHDTGLREDRKTHHLVSGTIIRADKRLERWFSPEQIETIAQAAEDHRASSDHEPRSIYGRLIAEADRQIDPMTIIRRTIQYGLSHNPELDREGHYERTLAHIGEKYDFGGYLKLWIPESSNSERLAELRTIIADKPRLRQIFEEIFASETL